MERLPELTARLKDYESKLDVMWAKLDNLAGAYRRCDEARQRLRDSSDHFLAVQQRVGNKNIDITKDEATLRELESVSGQVVAEILERLETQRRVHMELETRVEASRKQISELEKAIAVLESQLSTFDQTSQVCDDERREAADWFGVIGGHGLIDFAVDELDAPPQPWSLTQAIKVRAPPMGLWMKSGATTSLGSNLKIEFTSNTPCCNKRCCRRMELGRTSIIYAMVCNW